jgi:hypothetical protein
MMMALFKVVYLAQAWTGGNWHGDENEWPRLTSASNRNEEQYREKIRSFSVTDISGRTPRRVQRRGADAERCA